MTHYLNLDPDEELSARRAAMDTALSALTNAAQLIDSFKNGKPTGAWTEWDETTRRAISYSLERFYAIERAPPAPQKTTSMTTPPVRSDDHG